MDLVLTTDGPLFCREVAKGIWAVGKRGGVWSGTLNRMWLAELSCPLCLEGFLEEEGWQGWRWS